MHARQGGQGHGGQVERRQARRQVAREGRPREPWQMEDRKVGGGTGIEKQWSHNMDQRIGSVRRRAGQGYQGHGCGVVCGVQGGERSKRSQVMVRLFADICCEGWRAGWRAGWRGTAGDVKRAVVCANPLASCASAGLAELAARRSCLRLAAAGQGGRQAVQRFSRFQLVRRSIRCGSGRCGGARCSGCKVGRRHAWVQLLPAARSHHLTHPPPHVGQREPAPQRGGFED